MKEILDKKLLKFIIVGVINTLVGMTIMLVLYNIFYFDYWVSSSICYILTSILSFFLNKYFTFQAKGSGLKQIFRFALNIAICYFLAYAMAKPFIYWILKGSASVIQDNISMLVGLFLFTGFNYIGQRFFAFRNDKVID